MIYKFIRRTSDVARFISHPLKTNQPIDDWRQVMVGFVIKLFTLKIWFKKHCSILVPILWPDVRRPKSSRCQIVMLSQLNIGGIHFAEDEKKISRSKYTFRRCSLHTQLNTISFFVTYCATLFHLSCESKNKNIEVWKENEERTLAHSSWRWTSTRKRRRLGCAILWIWR